MDLNLNTLFASLTVSDDAPFSPPEWLAESRREPLLFWEGVLAAQDAHFDRPRKHRPFKAYDFYHDIVIRNLKNPSPALRIFTSEWQDYSYDTLGRRSARLAGHWEKLGVASGDMLCLIHAMGLEMVVALLAALKTGAVISILPPWGNRFLQRRLDALEPDHICRSADFVGFIGPWEERVLANDTAGGDRRPEMETSQAYTSGSQLGRFFDPCSATPDVPKDLTCDAAYLYAVRDGLVSLNLHPGRTCAMPGWPLMEALPAQLLACLLNGGTYAHFEVDQVQACPDLLQTPIHTMGVTTRFRDILIAHPASEELPWRIWFKDPVADSDMDQWYPFIKRNRLDDTFSANLKWHAAAGGCSLFSTWHRGLPQSHVLPPAGLPWQMGTSTEEPDSMGDGDGLLSFTHTVGGDAVETTPWMFTAHSRQWIFTGTQVTGRKARAYLFEDVLDLLDELPFSCSLVPSSGTSGGQSAKIVLVVFTAGYADLPPAEIISTVRRRISSEIGAEWLPDQYCFFPLHPEIDVNGRVDPQWCRRLYSSGSLHRRSKDEVFLHIAVLRQKLFPKKQHVYGKEKNHGNSG